MKLKVQLIDCNGKASEGKKYNLHLDLGYMEFQGIPSPVPAGGTAISVDMKHSNLVPSALVDSTTHVTAKAASGENVLFVNVLTTTSQDDAVQVQVLESKSSQSFAA